MGRSVYQSTISYKFNILGNSYLPDEKAIFQHAAPHPRRMKYQGDKWRGPPYHMIIHALQTGYFICFPELSGLQIPRSYIQNRLLYTLNGEKVDKDIFWRCKNTSNTNVFFYIIKDRFFHYSIVNTTFKKFIDDL